MLSMKCFDKRQPQHFLSQKFPTNYIACNSCNTGMSALPDMYTRRPRECSTRG